MGEEGESRARLSWWSRRERQRRLMGERKAKVKGDEEGKRNDVCVLDT